MDGGLRQSGKSAIGLAIYSYRDGSYSPIFYSGQALNGVGSAFQSESTALEVALDVIMKT